MKFDKITFTGSTFTGKLVAQAAAANLVPTHLELGGKSPVVIDETADVQYAAMLTLSGKMANFGQICIASDYVLCHESKVDQFITALRVILRDNFNGGTEKKNYSNIVS